MIRPKRSAINGKHLQNMLCHVIVYKSESCQKICLTNLRIYVIFTIATQVFAKKRQLWYWILLQNSKYWFIDCQINCWSTLIPSMLWKFNFASNLHSIHYLTLIQINYSCFCYKFVCVQFIHYISCIRISFFQQ